MPNFTIGISSSMLEPRLNRGIIDGIGQYTRQLIARFPNHDVKYKPFVFLPKNFPSALGDQTQSFGHSYQYYMLKSLLTGGKLSPYQANVDLFHCTDYKLIPMNCPTILTLHDAIRIAHPEWSGNKLKNLLVTHILKKNAKLGHHIIAISEHAAKDVMHHFHIKENRVSVIYPGVDEAWFQAVEDEKIQAIRYKYGLSAPYILSVGTIQPRKNFDALIDAYLALPLGLQKTVKLVIVGKYGWNSKKLLNRMKILQKEQGLIWLSNVNADEDLRCIYKGARLFVFPSLYEGFGLPLAEAFASGIPVVCSNHSCLPEISQNAALEVNPNSIGELSEAMKVLLEDELERAKRIQRGLLRAASLSWENTLKGTIKVYEKTLAVS